ncbi:hypothetical protein [Polaribacter sp. Z022]|uniref:hypothetical protein n=1 Tax=Polaribacter sp. Z022 TaxID=2927125 RepID=UPI00202066D9|nr:hypothetical protein [Polaribacter sp. Z022]MCL7754650.1 hypothetical protein [Polaribacter sp. Z022]
MKKTLTLLIIYYLFFSCTTSKAIRNTAVNNGDCKYIFKNGFQNITDNNVLLVIKNDTLLLTEIKYECTFHSFYTGGIMYNKYGKWNNTLSTNNGMAMMIWNDIKLFKNDTTRFNIATKGTENTKTINSSIMVYDNNYNDLLSENSKYREKLIDYFSKRIKRYRNIDKFYEEYWKTVDPKRWETIQFNRKISKNINKKH